MEIFIKLKLLQKSLCKKNSIFNNQNTVNGIKLLNKIKISIGFEL
jgi:hypothetical protein